MFSFPINILQENWDLKIQHKKIWIYSKENQTTEQEIHEKYDKKHPAGIVIGYDCNSLIIYKSTRPKDNEIQAKESEQ